VLQLNDAALLDIVRYYTREAAVMNYLDASRKRFFPLPR